MAKVWRTRYGESQNAIAFNPSVADPTLEVTDSSLAIWVGDTPEPRRVSEITNALDNCMNALIEASCPVPTLSYLAASYIDINNSKVDIVVADTAGIEFGETFVSVLYGPNYPENATGDGRNQLMVSQFEWLKEAFLEWSKRNA